MKASLFLLPLCFASTTSQYDQCYDLQKNGDETSIDCGGDVCWQRCAVGEECRTFYDCESMRCLDDGICGEKDLAVRFLHNGSGPAEIPPSTQYVHMPYDEFNRAILVIILVFILPCGMLVLYLLYKIYKQSINEEGGLVQGFDPARVELIRKEERNLRDDVIEETI